jgi:hypothetical protein
MKKERQVTLHVARSQKVFPQVLVSRLPGSSQVLDLKADNGLGRRRLPPNASANLCVYESRTQEFR